MTFEFTPGAHLIATDKPLGPIKTFSFSSLTKFEKCAYSVYLGKVEGYKEPSGPAADRGTQIHLAWEQYIDGTAPALINGGKKPNLVYAQTLRDAYAAGQVQVENEWTFDVNWNLVPPKTPEVWGIFKLDVFWRQSRTSAKIIDHKSGRMFGNELKHGEQGMFYAVAALTAEPELDYVEATFNYVDEGQISTPKIWRREDLGIFLPRLTKRAMAMTTATEFPPSPSRHNCKWCKYKDEVTDTNGQPVCVWGVIE